MASASSTRTCKITLIKGGKLMDIVDKVIAYEDGTLDEQATIAFFQELIDSGWVWQLQGRYGRTAASLIEAGLCTRRPVKRDREG